MATRHRDKDVSSGKQSSELLLGQLRGLRLSAKPLQGASSLLVAGEESEPPTETPIFASRNVLSVKVSGGLSGELAL